MTGRRTAALLAEVDRMTARCVDALLAEVIA
jgi:hypothetical protein